MTSSVPLKPSILDKLLSGAGALRRDRLNVYVPHLDGFGERELRGCIQRDVAWLLNDTCFGAAVSLDDYPEIKTSVLNQGLPELTGRALDHAAMDRRALEVTEAIRAFEQRLRPDSIIVRFNKDLVESENKLQVSISGEIRNAVEESWIELTTTVDLDDGHIETPS